MKKIKLVYALLIILTVMDLFRFGWKYNPFIKKELIYPQTPIINFLKSNAGNFRIEREKTEIFPPNTWVPYQLYSPSGYDPLVPLSYAQFHNVLNGNWATDGVSRYLELANYNSSLLDFLSVKYLVVAKREKNRIDEYSNDISSTISPSKYKRVFTDKSIVVLENTQVLPHVQLYGKFSVDQNYLSTLESIHKGINFKEQVILDRQPDLVIKEINSKDRAKVIDYQEDQLTIDVKNKNNAILVLSDTNYPGWNVYVNGTKAPLMFANGIFRAVAVPSGGSKVNFKFEPNSFKMGLIISATCAVLVILITISLMVLKRKKYA